MSTPLAHVGIGSDRTHPSSSAIELKKKRQCGCKQSQIASWQLHVGTRTRRPACGMGATGSASLRRGEGRMGADKTVGGGSGERSAVLLTAAGMRGEAGSAAGAGAAIVGFETLGNAVHAHAPPAMEMAAAATRVTQRRVVASVGFRRGA